MPLKPHDFGPRGQPLSPRIERAAADLHLFGVVTDDDLDEDFGDRHKHWLAQQDLDEDVPEAYHDSLERLCDEPYEPDFDDFDE